MYFHLAYGNQQFNTVFKNVILLPAWKFSRYFSPKFHQMSKKIIIIFNFPSAYSGFNGINCFTSIETWMKRRKIEFVDIFWSFGRTWGYVYKTLNIIGGVQRDFTDALYQPTCPYVLVAWVDGFSTVCTEMFGISHKMS